ncbi:MAG: hypothetical protein JWP64_6057 [Pseudonocardia sp.]|jgi:hypothetical protein|uniref:hypothetical protein n=1 Tax=Pseudonocardia sp. TaxID=60912 RepID=UPI002633F1A5|nr:hypothetical protein [Pseudonocardia sp.]MCU1631108.1 hypothetical protein [Pseudonocardia sp.]MDT7702024.1 hypothetical protein [Pseudonocardiales bacterium]
MSTPLPASAALGRVSRLPGRTIAIRATILVLLLAAALVARGTGVLHPAQDQTVPPLPAAAVVVPGVFRSATPTETELVLLRDTFAVRGVVSVGAASVEEQAVVPALGMRLLRLDVVEGAAPTAAQVLALRNFLRTVPAPDTVLLHDATGDGPVLVTAAMVQLVRGRPLDAVPEGLSPAETEALSDAQRQSLTDAAAALSGTANSYSDLSR